MRGREKILVIAIGAVLAAVILYSAVNKLLLAKLRGRDEQIADLRDGNAKLEAENGWLEPLIDRWTLLRDRTFHDDPYQAMVQVEKRLKALIQQAGLDSVPVKPILKGGVRDAYQEITCTLAGVATLPRLTNLLYALRREKRLTRVSNLTINPQRERGRGVSYSLQYSTLVLDPKIPTGPTKARSEQFAAEADKLVALNSPERAAYDVIAARNLFLPYVPRVEAPPQPQPEVVVAAPQPPAPTPQPPVPSPAYDRLVVTGLPSFGRQREVHVTTPGSPIEKPLLVGDELPIGRIAMVDYRVLPMPGDPKQLSTGRVILQIGQDYWAVELGWTLGQRRLLRPGELPEELKPKPAPSPGPTNAPAGDNVGAMLQP